MVCWISVLERSFTTSDPELITDESQGISFVYSCLCSYEYELDKKHFSYLDEIEVIEKICDIKIQNYTNVNTFLNDN